MLIEVERNTEWELWGQQFLFYFMESLFNNQLASRSENWNLFSVHNILYLLKYINLL